ncbi:MAG: peptide transporter [Puniceicoccaceae bacterium]|nr:MAG: peptide transporter [Puniceicoccaceae bacterium]
MIFKKSPPETKSRQDRELEEFRNLMKPPGTFEEGFNWTALFGAFFISMIMIPGAIYMGLLAGEANIGPAAQWVTVILFIEAARRAQQNLRKAEIFILFFMAGTAMSMPFTGLLWNQYYVQSEPAIAAGIAENIPYWWAPQPESESFLTRTFFHLDWLPVIGLVLFQAFFSQLNSMVLGYGLFRMTSDVEKLPFPMAPIGAQGILALAEDPDDDPERKGTSWRWRVFSIGGALGLGFGTIYLGLPIITEVFAGEPIKFLDIPWTDTSGTTAPILPAVATGLSWDLGNLLIGMVLPFYAMVGSFVGLVVTMVGNPVLYHFGVLDSWVPGDDTVQTVFKNNVDFYLSFQIGISLAVAIVGIWQVVKAIRARLAHRRREGPDALSDIAPPEGRGDIRPGFILVCYFVVTLIYVLVCGWLIDWHPGVMVVLIFLGFFYTPLISYVTARLEGIAGQVVEIPMIREASFILSGYRGVAVWFLPVPIANYGGMTVLYRQAELTGTKFTSIWKTQLILYPIILASSMLFASFIWGLAPIPSATYPFAEVMWELNALNTSIIQSSTIGEYSIFEDALDFGNIGWGTGFGLALFWFMGVAHAPVFLTYGVVRGLGQSLPHMIIPQFIGALIGRYYFQKRLGVKWRQYIPVVTAGFACGTGLITTACMGIKFLSSAAVNLPF